jgi:glycosyltransferase involved in cell wall biosynthesis
LHICKTFSFILKHISLTVINDLNYDQRMQRICTSLAENGYAVTLVGRILPSSLPLTDKKYKQKRIKCWFNTGKFFYAEYNLRLILFFLFRKTDAICAIDLDTIIPCYYVSRIKNIPRTYDAHEFFTEQKEIVTRPRIQKWWKKVEVRFIPKYKSGYTVSNSIARAFKELYNADYLTIRNLPVLINGNEAETHHTEKFILYQGAVNEARGLEHLIPAMQHINYKLVICGDGNFMPQLKKIITGYNLQDKIELKGMVAPDVLRHISRQAFIGINLVENTGLNQYYSLANKFFDYIHAGLPQVTMNFPEYKKVNNQYPVAVLIDDTSPGQIAAAINQLADDTLLYQTLQQNCLKARTELSWQQEEKILLSFYQSIFNK